MGNDDVVAELDAWLSVTRKRPDEQWLTSRWMVERARDEIVGLREQLNRQPQGIAHVRAEARDDALADCIRICPECANRIKALNTVGARHLRGERP